MTAKVISPFEGAPKTCEWVDDQGRTWFEIQTHTLTPLRAKVADLVAGSAALGLSGNYLYQALQMPEAPPLAWAAVLLAAPLTHPVFRKISRWLGKSYTDIHISEDRFSVRQEWRWRHYDRKLPHKFTLLVHDKAQREAQRHELEVRQASARGQVISKRKYYGDSYHLIYEYVGQRVDVVTIFGRKEALRIQERLNACDQVLKQQAHQSDGVALAPDAQWDDQPGDL